MLPVRILHNPRCSKSRQTLQLLQAHGVEPHIVEYLKTPLDEAQLAVLFDQLNISRIEDMMRLKEPEYKQAGLSSPVTKEQGIQAMAAYPKLLERPIVIKGDKACIGRPPEAVLALL